VTITLQNRDAIAEALDARGAQQERLFAHARALRARYFGDAVEVRSVIEYANVCEQHCLYCGMAKERKISRYVLDQQELLGRFEALYAIGRRVIMVQSGECTAAPYLETLVGALTEATRRHPDVAWIFSLGLLDPAWYKRLRTLGRHRYLLKFETSCAELFARFKPGETLARRLEHLALLRQMGFVVSSGNITGLPGQTLEQLADDLMLLQKLNVDLASTSPFVPHDLTPLAARPAADPNLTLNFMAVLRSLLPHALIPATSALSKIVDDGQYRGLMAGANVVTCHDGTPAEAAAQFVLYSSSRPLPGAELLEVVTRAGLTPVAGPVRPRLSPPASELGAVEEE